MDLTLTPTRNSAYDIVPDASLSNLIFFKSFRKGFNKTLTEIIEEMLDCFGHQVCELQLSHSFIELLGFGHRSQSFGKDAPLPYKVADHLEAQHASVVIVHDAELPRQPHDT